MNLLAEAQERAHLLNESIAIQRDYQRRRLFRKRPTAASDRHDLSVAVRANRQTRAVGVWIS
jgi:hypothetical protein